MENVMHNFGFMLDLEVDNYIIKLGENRTPLVWHGEEKSNLIFQINKDYIYHTIQAVWISSPALQNIKVYLKG